MSQSRCKVDLVSCTAGLSVGKAQHNSASSEHVKCVIASVANEPNILNDHIWSETTRSGVVAPLRATTSLRSDDFVAVRNSALSPAP